MGFVVFKDPELTRLLPPRRILHFGDVILKADPSATLVGSSETFMESIDPPISTRVSSRCARFLF